jgi:type II secretory pathway component PulK
VRRSVAPRARRRGGTGEYGGGAFGAGRSREGLALLLVLGFVTLLCGVSVAFHDQMAARLAEARMAALDAEALVLARSGVVLARLLIKADTRPYTYLFREEGSAELRSEVHRAKVKEKSKLEKILEMVAATDEVPLPVEGGLLSIRLTDENALLNLNRVDEGTLVNLFATVGLKRLKKLELLGETVEEDISREAAVSIINWRSPEGQKRRGGADDDYYRKLEPPYRTRSAPFESVEELLLVKDITALAFQGTAPEVPLVDGAAAGGTDAGAPPRAVRASPASAAGLGARAGAGDPKELEERTTRKVIGIGPLFTVFGDGKVNVNGASRHVLRVLPGLVSSRSAERIAHDLVDQRPYRDMGEVQSVISRIDQQVAAAATASMKVQSGLFRVRAVARKGIRARAVEVVLSRAGVGAPLKTFLYKED